MLKFATDAADSPKSIRVRFAPSPTGDLHVGGVRTALFNYLFARHTGGKFLLRIEDTDKERSTPAAIQVILDGLAWLGVTPDEPVVYQSARIERHKEAAYQILKSGLGYRCFCNPEELTAKREAARSIGKPFKYDRTCLKLKPAEIEGKLAAGTPWAVRVRVPDEDLTFEDGVHSEVRILGEDLEDFVLLRGDGTPTYMLAVVVDDADMGITHIIRGDEHLLNTPKQILIYKAMGCPVPRFAHVPLILGTDKKKLSKRHGATSITWYKEQGYLPETMLNFLGLLGWSPGDDRNVISRDELIELFDVSGIIPHGAVFDEQKLRWLNGQYISKTDFQSVRKSLLTYAEQAAADGRLERLPDEAYLEQVWNLIRSRIYFLSDLFYSALYLFQDPTSYDEKGMRKHFQKEGIADRLKTLSGDFESISRWTAVSIEETIRRRAEEWGASASELIHPLRLAVSGVTVGPGLFELLEVLGKEAVVKRIFIAVERIKQ
ncbi:MAG: glutamate--tRNA ligase [Calditrichaeota bacterium]|nr:glutamate--tRNA ligase [Calditrichota bacterium]